MPSAEEIRLRIVEGLLRNHGQLAINHTDTFLGAVAKIETFVVSSTTTTEAAPAKALSRKKDKPVDDFASVD